MYVIFANVVRLNHKDKMGHLERKQREKERVRQDILNAALSIAKSKGWQAVTVRKIAEEIEYTPPIVYEHFESKEDLIRELVQNGFRTLHDGFEKESKAELDPKEKLCKLSLVHWDFAFANKELYQLMFSLERPQPTDAMNRGISIIKETFVQLTNKQEEELMLPIFNWICLMYGTITTMIRLEGASFPHVVKETPREIFLSFIKRFASTL